MEPVLLLGKDRFAGVDIRVRVKGGGHISQLYGMFYVALLPGQMKPKFPECLLISLEQLVLQNANA